MPPTIALSRFKASLNQARALIQLEVAQFTDPPSPADLDQVLGLRGGAAVLMVAAFENFLIEFCPEVLLPLSDRRKVRFERLPEAAQTQSIFGTLEAALDGPPYGPKGPKFDRIPAVLAASQQVTVGALNPEVFGATNGNPSAERVKRLFAEAGIPDALYTARPVFEKKWGSATSARFIPDTLDSVLQRRHRVAHRADALSISRVDLRESIRFLRLLGESLDQAVRGEIRVMHRNARI